MWPYNSQAAASPSRLADSFVCPGALLLITTEVIAELKDITPMSKEREEEILEEEVIRAINMLKNNKSQGNDEITGEMIKGGGEIAAKELHKIINEAWKEGRTPEEWKKSILVI